MCHLDNKTVSSNAPCQCLPDHSIQFTSCNFGLGFLTDVSFGQCSRIRGQPLKKT